MRLGGGVRSTQVMRSQQFNENETSDFFFFFSLIAISPLHINLHSQIRRCQISLVYEIQTPYFQLLVRTKLCDFP